MTEYQKMLAGQIYDPTDPEIAKLSRAAKHRAYLLNTTDPAAVELYLKRLYDLFPGLGPNSYMAPNVQVDYGIHLKTGKNFYANYGAVILDVSPVEIGDDAMFGVDVHVVTPVHPLLAEERIQRQKADGSYYDLEYSKPVYIGNRVWVASDVTICGGVRIGDDSVIAAGAVVTKDIPPGVLAGGVPCRAIRPLTEADRLNIYPRG